MIYRHLISMYLHKLLTCYRKFNYQSTSSRTDSNSNQSPRVQRQVSRARQGMLTLSKLLILLKFCKGICVVQPFIFPVFRLSFSLVQICHFSMEHERLIYHIGILRWTYFIALRLKFLSRIFIMFHHLFIRCRIHSFAFRTYACFIILCHMA